MNLGQGISTASGVLHEIDLVARDSELHCFVELKNRSGYAPEKNDVIVFFAKLFDYLAMNADLLLTELCPVFMSATTFELSGMAACLGLGIHPVAPSIRPLPVLIFNAMCLEVEISKLTHVPPKLIENFEDYCANVNKMSLVLNETWMSNRCSRIAEDRLLLKAGGALDSWVLADEFMALNSAYIDLRDQFGRLREGA
jgi:hypothetical protein